MVKVLMFGMQEQEAVITLNGVEFALFYTNLAVEAFMYIKESAPHAIVIHTGRMAKNALKLIKQIKKNPVSRHIPMIFLVNDENEEKYEKYYEDVNTIGLMDTASYESILFHVKQLVVKKIKERKKILVVDDDDITRSITNRFLHPEYQIVNASSAKEALHYLSHNTVDLIILDIMMPDINGIELFKTLQKMETVKDIPKLFQTSVADLNTVKTCIKLGPAGYLVKPIDKEELLNRVDYILTYGTEKLYEAEKPAKILYIDKNKSNVRQMKAMVQDNYEVIWESGGIHAVTIAQAMEFEYIMINMENSRFCIPKLKKKLEHLQKDIRVILVATDQFQDYELCSNTHFDVTVLKYPISKEVLLETLEADG